MISHEKRLIEKDDEHTQALKACQMNGDVRFTELEIQLQLSRDKEIELMKRLSEFSVTENRLRDKVLASENEFAERLQSGAMRERELNDKLNHLNRQLQAADARYRDLEIQTKLQQDELAVMRQNRIIQINNDLLNGHASLNHSGNQPSTNDCSGNIQSCTQMLQDEVESLRSVLELKQTEISELRKINRELQNSRDELPKVQFKVSCLESRLEDLSLKYQSKCEEEK